MSEDDYTGKLFDDDNYLSEFKKFFVDINEIDLDNNFLSFADSENEVEIVYGNFANGSTSLRDVAERMYDLADDILSLSLDGWEIIDSVKNGRAAVIKFDVDELDKESNNE
jgi:MoaA/NifB/PqqE/SkfB family radical SAM enzyme